MLRSLKDLEGYKISATDGDIGSVADFLIDDTHWTVRYLVAKTGGFFSERQVLISPIAFRSADWSTRHFNVALTKERVKASPSIDVDKPVSRQYERDYYRYYGYPLYWGYSGLWGMGANPGFLSAGNPMEAVPPRTDESGDAHLRSASEVRGYYIQGSDDAIGHVDDFVVDDETWQVRYLIVDTSNWWFGNKVLIAPRWASRVSWDERAVHVDMSRQAIKDSPQWDPNAPVNQDYETRLYDYYGRPVDWK